MNRKIRVLIVDDSALVRRILSDSLSGEPDIEVVGSAPDPVAAAELMDRVKPDVLTLDVEMPRMDGLTFLKRLMRGRPMPVIMISSLAQKSSRIAIEALAEGAVEVLAKPDGPYSVGEFRYSLGRKIRSAAVARVRRRSESPAHSTPPPIPTQVQASVQADTTRLIAIGASTGGTEAIEAILRALPAQMPPIVIVQHIPAGFSKAFAERLDRLCALNVREAVDGDYATPGQALVAPGNFHMRLTRAGGRYRASIAGGELVCYQRPSVDVLFESIAGLTAASSIGVLLTGMGADGAAGLLRLRQGGARTIAQDERSCAVFGMPREAIRMGAASEVLALDRVAARLCALCSTRELPSSQAVCHR